MPRSWGDASLPAARVLGAALLSVACTAEPWDPVKAFDEDPQETARRVAAIEDPLRQEATILRLSEAYPGRVGPLCQLLQGEGAMAFCERLARRPHLGLSGHGASHEAAGEAAKRAASGPSSPEVPFPAALLTSWESTPPDAGACQEGSVRFHSCLSQAASQQARAGHPERAAALCKAASSKKWRQDCFFNAAEAVSVAPTSYGDAMSLCLGSGDYIQPCVGHLTVRMIPKEVRERAQLYAQLQRGEKELFAYWQEHAPTVKSQMSDLYWAMVVDSLYMRNPTTGEPFDHLSPAAWPHIRTALAWRTVGCPEPFAAAKRAADRRLGGSLCPSGVKPVRARGGNKVGSAKGGGLPRRGSHWNFDMEGEEGIPAIYFPAQGLGRRATDVDPELDLRLAVLSVLGFQDPLPADQIAACLQDAEPLMRWTAARILADMAPTHPTLRAALDDPDPRVRLRAALAAGG